MAITGLNDRSKMSAYKALVSEQDKEIAKLKAEIERKDEALQEIAVKALIIQNLPYGWDGDCGKKRQAEIIEYLSDKALQSEVK